MTDIKIVLGDITKIKVDAIVNAANKSLLGGGGVDGAIHRAGGQKILEECKIIRHKQGGCKTGEAVITTAGNLPSKFVIHTVGPIWSGGNNREEELLSSSYNNCLNLAVERNLKSIAFPNISTGIYGFPKELAAKVAANAVKKFSTIASSLEEVIFICFDEENYNLYKNILNY